MKKCLGFWDANSEICDWEDEAGTKPILEIKMRKTFPCVPVSELKKAIEKIKKQKYTGGLLESEKKHIFDNIYPVNAFIKELEKELGLSEKKKVVEFKTRGNNSVRFKVRTKKKEKPVVRVRFGRGNYPTELKVVRGVK